MKNKYPLILLFSYIIFWVLSAINPLYRRVWFAENILSILLILTLVFTYRKYRFSNISYTLMFVFMILHMVGAHYSYSEVPLFDFVKDSWGLERNHYDRLVHFLFGILFYYPIFEISKQKFKIKGWLSYFIPFIVIVASKGIFEVLEVGYHYIEESKIITDNYLGMQGDPWDAQKDIFLGMLGALIGWIATYNRNK